MAYDRIGTGPWAWLKSVGSQEDPLHADWRYEDGHLLNQVWFSKHPRSIRAGDIFVYYAARHAVLPAIMEVVSDEVEGYQSEPRWKYSMAVRPIVSLGLRVAPALADTPIDPLRVRRQSHIFLEPKEFVVIRDLMLVAARTSLNVITPETAVA